MEKIEFIVGSEKRFLEFISNLNEKDKIALISHSRDIDGIVSAKVANSVIDANFIKLADYDEVGKSLIEELKRNKINKVIMTDLGTDAKEFFKELEKFTEVLIIDHHTFVEDLNSKKTVFLNTSGYCASYISYYLFSKIKNLEKMDWLVALASVSDWLYYENKKFVEEVYKKYGDEFKTEGNYAKQEGEFWGILTNIYNAIMYFNKDAKKVFDSIGEGFGEIGDLAKYAYEVQEEIDKNMEKFWKEKKEINGRDIFVFKPKFPVGAVISSKISLTIKDKTLLIIEEKENGYHIHARRRDGNENMAILVKRMVKDLENASGGGHIPAAGGHFLKKDFDMVMERLKEF